MYFVLFILSILVLVFSTSVINRVVGSFSAIKWVEVSAELKSASIEEQRGGKSSISGFRYSYFTPSITYEYSYAGKRYTGNRVSWQKTYDDSDMLNKAQEFKLKFKHQTPIIIYVNPDDHAESIVYREVNWHHFKTMLIVCVVLWLLFFSCIYILIKKLKAE